MDFYPTSDYFVIYLEVFFKKSSQDYNKTFDLIVHKKPLH